MLKTIRTLGAAGAVLALAAFAPGVAQAHGHHHSHSDQGLHCGRHHAKHSRKLGKQCQAANTRGHHSSTTTANDTSGTNTSSGDQSSTNPAKTCRQEQSSDASTFQSDYGSGRDAFGKCVSQHAKQQDQGDSQDQSQSGDDDSSDSGTDS